MNTMMTVLNSHLAHCFALTFALTQLLGLNNATLAQSIYFDDSDSETMKLGNLSNYEVGFRNTNGSIAYILDKATGDTVSLGSHSEHLWGATFPDADYTFVGSAFYDSSGDGRFSYAWIDSIRTLKLHYTPDSAGELNVSADVEVVPSDGTFFDLVLTVNHEFGVPLEYVIFPSDLVFKKSKIDEALLPVIPGVILERSFFQESRSYTTKYPGWPGVFSDFVSIKLNNSSYTVYSIYQPENPIPVVEIGFVNDDHYIPNSTYSKHVYRTYIPDKKEWASPTVRIHIGQ